MHRSRHAYYVFRRNIFTASNIDISKLSTKCLGRYAFDILRISKGNGELYQRFIKRVEESVDFFDAKDSYRILKSLEISNNLNEKELIKKILRRVSVHCCNYSVKEICDICFLCSKLPFLYIPLFASLSISFINKINLAGPSDLATIALSFSKVQLKDMHLFNRIGIATVNILSVFDIESLITILTAFAYINVKNSFLLYGSIELLVKNKNKISPDQLVKVAYVYAKFGVVHKDMCWLLNYKLPDVIFLLKNIQLAELLISLKRLEIPIPHYATSVFANIDLSLLKFPLAIKVICALSSLNDFCFEIKSDDVLKLFRSWIFTHGRSTLPLSAEELDGELVKINTAGTILYNELILFRQERKIFLEKMGEGKRSFYIDADDTFDEKTSLDMLSDIAPLSEREEGHVDNDINYYYYYYWNYKSKFSEHVLCSLNTDLFESICSLLLRNNVMEYRRTLKFYLNCVSRELIRLKNYIPISCLIKIFQSLQKLPIVWTLSFLAFCSRNPLQQKEFLLFINENSTFYKELLERYFTVHNTCTDVDTHSKILYSIITLFKTNEIISVADSLKNCFEFYSAILQKRENIKEVSQNEEEDLYKIQHNHCELEELVIYNHVEFYHKNVPLWKKRSNYKRLVHLLSNAHFSQNVSIEDVDEIIRGQSSQIGLNDPIPNKIVSTELFNIIKKWNKHIKMNFREGLYLVPLVEYDNYVAYIFLEPWNYVYSPHSEAPLKYANEGVTNYVKKKNGIILIRDVHFNPYETFFNEHFLINAEIFTKINYLLITGYSVIAIPFFIWRCLSSTEKEEALHFLRCANLSNW